MSMLQKRHLESEAIRLDSIAGALNAVRKSTICAYGADEVNSEGRPFLCDCKNGGPSISAGTEQTGCPEIRDIVYRYRNEAHKARTSANAYVGE